MDEKFLIELEKINQRLTAIEEQIKHISCTTERMDNHITFIEKVYDVIKFPFFNAFGIIGFKQDTNLLKNDISDN